MTNAIAELEQQTTQLILRDGEKIVASQAHAPMGTGLSILLLGSVILTLIATVAIAVKALFNQPKNQRY